MNDRRMKLKDVLSSLKGRHIEALVMGAAKKRAKVFFVDPKAMIALRKEAESRRAQGEMK